MHELDPITNHRKGALEALLFTSSDPVSAVTLAQILDLKPGEVEALLAELSAEYSDKERGIQLREVAGGWRMFSHPAYHEHIEEYVRSWDTHKLSQAALEALAVVAYHQPVTREGVKAVRGVNSDGVISSLVEKGLVREVGREKTLGQAILYGTTQVFLEKFGLRSIAELPPLEDFAPDEESKRFIRERLSGKPVQGYLADMDEDLDELEEDLYDELDDEYDADDIELVGDDETVLAVEWDEER